MTSSATETRQADLRLALTNAQNEILQMYELGASIEECVNLARQTYRELWLDIMQGEAWGAIRSNRIAKEKLCSDLS